MSLLLEEDKNLCLNLEWQPPKLPSLSMLVREQNNNLTLTEMIEADERQEERKMYMLTFGAELL